MANKLLINTEKTKIMIMNNNKKKKKLKLTLKNGDIIEDDHAIKILGWWSMPTDSMNEHLNKICGITYKNLAEVKPLLKFMSLENRRQIVYSKVLGAAFYGLGIYASQTELIKDKFTAIVMKGNRAIYGLPVPSKTKEEYICQKIGKKTPQQLILEACSKFMHKIVNNQTPHKIFNQLTFQRKFRKNARLHTKRPPKTKKGKRSTIYKSLSIFNSLHSSLKFVHPKTFKKLIEKRKIVEIPDD